MHGWIDSEISVILFTLIVIVVVSLGFAHHMTLKSNCRSKKSHKLKIDIGAFVEREEQEEQVATYYKSMLVTHSTCVICQNPTTQRCSRCKLTKYCNSCWFSSECQVAHWKESHKNKCCAPKANSFESAIKKSKNMCNGDQLKTTTTLDSQNSLNPISLGFFKSFNIKNNEERKPLPNHMVNASSDILTTTSSLSRPKTLLFPYKYFVKLFGWEGLKEPCGLINCGNSCFANVVLQCLTYTRPLTAYLLDGCHGEDCRRNDWCFMCELQNHVYKVRHSQNPFSPLQILSRIRNIGNHLGYGRQEDAHEFMRFAIDSMQSICLDEVGGEKAIDHATQETTLIHHIFGGYLQSQVKCMQCKHESNRYESMMDLAVEIHGLVESLEDAIAQFTTIEMLDGDNKYKCDNCNAYVKAQKQLSLYEAPNILTIALKRFQSGKFGKLNKRVSFPEVLNMSPYMSGGKAKLPLYKLFAAVVHVDMLNASFFGHYICYVKDSNGLWYKIDDNKVKEVELEKVLAQRAYMLFYSRSKARVEPQTKEEPSPTLNMFLAPNVTNISCIESQRSSNFSPTSCTNTLPTQFSRDYIKGQKAMQLNSSKEISTAYENDENFGFEEETRKTPISTSTIPCREKFVKESNFPKDMIPLTNSTICGTLDGSFATQASNYDLSYNRSTIKNKLPLYKQNDDHEINNTKSMPQPNSLSKCLDVNLLESLSSKQLDHLSLKCKLQKNESNPSPPKDSIHNAHNLFQPSNLNNASIPLNHSTSSNLSNLFVETEISTLPDANFWRIVDSHKVNQQHIDNAFDRLELPTSSSSHKNSYGMDIDSKNRLVIDETLESKKTSHSPLEDVTSNNKTYSNKDNFQSSNDLLSPKSTHCSKKIFDTKDCDLKSTFKICEANVASMHENQQFGFLKEETQQPCDEGSILTNEHNLEKYNLMSSKETCDTLPRPVHKFDSLNEKSWILQPCHVCQVPNNELPPLIINSKKETSTTKITRSGIEIHEESYDIKPLEDDIPYVVVEAISTNSTIPQMYKEKCLQEDTINHFVEDCTPIIKDSITKCTNEEILDVSTTNYDAKLNEAQNKINAFSANTKFKKHTTKPLFFSGFLNKSPKSTCRNSMSKNVVVQSNGSRSGENNNGHFVEGDESLSNRRHTSTPVFNGEEDNNERLNCHIINNGICGNGIFDLHKKSKDLPSEIGRNNGVSIAI